MDSETANLSFCLNCGERVAPYSYSDAAYSDLNEYGKTSADFEGKAGVVTYRCKCSPRELLAPNHENTGTMCPGCGSFMNLFATHCGSCSRRLR